MKKSKIKSIVLGIVLYFPSQKELDIILSYLTCFENIFLYLNSQIEDKLSNHVLFHSNRVNCYGEFQNKGLSKPYNLFIQKCKVYNLPYLLILDQDSILPIDQNFDKLYSIENNSIPRDAALVCLSHFSKTKYLDYKLNKSAGCDLKPIYFNINSGSLIVIEKLLELGGYDESFFVDRVDIDICRTIYFNKFKIYKLKTNFILHDVGKPSRFNFLRFEFNINIHSHIRIYLIAYSRINYNRKWMIRNSNKFFIFKYLEFFTISSIQVIRHSFIILFFYDHKYSSIKYLFNGSLDSFLYKKSLYLDD